MDLNPSPLYLELTGVGELSLELCVGQLRGLQVSLETLKFFLELPRLQMSVVSFHGQRGSAPLLLLQLRNLLPQELDVESFALQLVFL